MNDNYTFTYEDRTLVVRQSRYQYGSGNQPAILCFDNTDPECSVASGIPYGVLTVNLDDPSCEHEDEDMPLMQFLDTNNWPGIEWLLRHEEVSWCEPTGVITQSGFVRYPMYYFDQNIPHV